MFSLFDVDLSASLLQSVNLFEYTVIIFFPTDLLPLGFVYKMTCNAHGTVNICCEMVHRASTIQV